MSARWRQSSEHGATVNKRRALLLLLCYAYGVAVSLALVLWSIQ